MTRRRTSASSTPSTSTAATTTTLREDILTITKQPDDKFYKDEGGKSNTLIAIVCAPISHLQLADETFPLKIQVWFETKEICDDEGVLQLMTPYQQPLYVSSDSPETEIPFRLEKVSRRKDGRRFMLKIEIDYDKMESPPSESNRLKGVFTNPIEVLSKRRKDRVSSRTRINSHTSANTKLNTSTNVNDNEIKLELAELRQTMQQVLERQQQILMLLSTPNTFPVHNMYSNASPTAFASGSVGTSSSSASSTAGTTGIPRTMQAPANTCVFGYATGQPIQKKENDEIHSGNAPNTRRSSSRRANTTVETRNTKRQRTSAEEETPAEDMTLGVQSMGVPTTAPIASLQANGQSLVFAPPNWNSGALLNLNGTMNSGSWSWMISNPLMDQHTMSAGIESKQIATSQS